LIEPVFVQRLLHQHMGCWVVTSRCVERTVLALVERGVQDPRVCAIASELARQGQGVDGGCWALMAANLQFKIFVIRLKSG
jgi:hypothetical protein